MSYIENPKTKGSGILCAIPQTGTCPVGCEDCFFQSGRSYLEPLEKNLPNLPSDDQAKGQVVRVNDGNDSNCQRNLVIQTAARYPEAFFNTSIARDLAGFGRPVVLTANPGKMTDSRAQLVSCPPNLMFVRFRTDTWNLELADRVVSHYTAKNVPVVLTFMAYYTESIPPEHAASYSFRNRTMNSYWVITPEAWDGVKARYADNPLVLTCGKDANTFACSQCGNCLRLYRETVGKMAE